MWAASAGEATVEKESRGRFVAFSIGQWNQNAGQVR
jgi:hypothetical protein